MLTLSRGLGAHHASLSPSHNKIRVLSSVVPNAKITPQVDEIEEGNWKLTIESNGSSALLSEPSRLSRLIGFPQDCSRGDQTGFSLLF